ncbi:D-alanyl-D-alanine carboxypeptidase [Streptomyces bauhiniae]
MAGESPDRSKQHEDSVGSAGSVADEELREAVSAWVRPPSGGSAKGKSAPPSGGSAGTGKGAAKKGSGPDDTFKDSGSAYGSAEGAEKDSASGSAEGEGEDTAEGASSDAEDTAAPAAEGSGNGASVPTAVDGTEGASGSAGDSGKDSGTSAAVGSETDASAPAAEGDSDSDPEAAPAPAAKTAGDHTEDASAAKDDSESAAKNASEATATPAAEGTSDAAKDTSATETASAAKDDSESAAQGAGAAAVPAAEGTLGSVDDASAAAVPAAKEAPGSAEDDDSTSGSADDAPAAGPDSAVKGDSGSAQVDSAVKDDSESAATGAGTIVAAGAAVAAAKGDAQSAAEDGRKAASGSGKDTRTPDAKGDDDAPVPGAEGTAVTTPKGDSASAPKAKDAEGTPGGGRSVDGVPEGSVKGTPLPAPRGDGKAPGKAVDTPTTALKSPGAGKAPVDQPTTMLKVGGKAKPAPAEQAAERTSKFVALKPDLKGPSARVEETRAVPQVGPERTTQQPLPPKPPLDLLAELTNTPPPPETPVRTLLRRVKIWTPLVILLVVILGVVQAMRPLPQPTLALTAKDSFTFEGGKPDIPWPTDGQAALDVQGIGSFGSSGSGKPVPIASVAKVMTAYLILRDHPLKSGAEGPKISIDKAAQDQSKAGQESTVDVTRGDKITQREALEGVLIASANNVARLLARWDAGSEKAFVAKMNAAAKGLGMSGTTYTDPSGLTNSTVSTAADQVKLAKAAMTQPAFREVAAMMSYTDYKGTYHSNWNQLVGHNGVVGIKTGTTTSALGNLVFAAKQDVGGETRMIIGAVLRQPPSKRDNSILSAAMDSSDALIRAAQGALKSETVLKKGTVVGYVDDGLGGQTPVEITEDVKAAGWAGLKVRLSFTSGTIPHTAKAGTEVGSLTVGDGSSAGAVKVPVALRADLAEPGLGAKLTRVG